VFENYYNSDYLKEHKYMYLQTETEIKKYEIFSVHVETSDWSYFSKIRFNSDTDYLNHLTELKNKSIYDTGVEINEKLSSNLFTSIRVALKTIFVDTSVSA
jgi:hypothetical protein